MENVRIEKEFEISLDNNTLDQYDVLLSKFKDWTKYKRDIKINSLIESGKRIEFTIELEHSPIYISAVIDENVDETINSLNNACAIVKYMKFIINENKIESLDIKITTLTTYYGKIIHDLVESGIEIKVNQYLDIYTKSIIGFYINDRTKKAA
jgi:hypothetical protein